MGTGIRAGAPPDGSEGGRGGGGMRGGGARLMPPARPRGRRGGSEGNFCCGTNFNRVCATSVAVSNPHCFRWERGWLEGQIPFRCSKGLTLIAMTLGRLRHLAKPLRRADAE